RASRRRSRRVSVKRPRISGNQIWCNHERRVLRILREALALLRTEASADVCEVALNRRFHRHIRRVNARLLTIDEGIESPIFCESSNQPDADDEQRAEREDKKPD